MRRNLLILLLSVFSFLTKAQTFTLVPIASSDHDVPGVKDGGAVWADFDNDGDLDLLVNTRNHTPRSVLLQNNNGVFTDVTSARAAGMTNVQCERSAVWGDLNNDGYIDFVRNDHDRIEIYINRGLIGGGYQNYSFGVDFPVGGPDEMLPNLTIIRLEGSACSAYRANGMNAEGVGLIDYNNDGWLDIIFENGECGIDILENGKNNSAATVNAFFGDGVLNDVSEATTNTFFFQVTIPTASPVSYLGLPSVSGNGDYFTLGDYDGDGLVDVVVRKPNHPSDPSNFRSNSIWKNNGNRTFTDINVYLGGVDLLNPAESNPGGKGGVVLCDFDMDGDFDIFWSDAGTNQIWLQISPGNFQPSGKPVIPGTPNIDGCACGDVDLDGDTDLFLGNNTGESYLFINQTTIPNSVVDLKFAPLPPDPPDPVEDKNSIIINLGTNVDAEGVNLIDYDGDGDYDIYVNVNGGANQMWENDLCDDGNCNFLNILIEDCVVGSNNETTSVTRPAVGASVYLTDTNTPRNIVTAKVDGSTASGHGSQNPSSPLIAIPDPTADYIAVVTFPVKDELAEIYHYQFNPSELTPPNTLILTSVRGTDGVPCSFSILPIELLSFTAEKNEEGIMIKWVTATELNNDYFVLEKSRNGKVFDEIYRVSGNGTTHAKVNYSYLDPYPYNGFNYYRLVQYDYDGKSTTSKIIRIKAETNRGDGIAVYPNPVKDRLTINFSEEWQNSKAVIAIHDLQGNKIAEREVSSPGNSIDFEWDHKIEGFYWIKISNPQQTVVKKLVKISE